MFAVGGVMPRLGALVSWLRERSRRHQQADTHFELRDGRRFIKLPDGEVMWTRVLGQAEGEKRPQVVYTWPTHQSASWLLQNCSPVRAGKDPSPLGHVDAVVFPSSDAPAFPSGSGPRKMSAQDFLDDAERLERSAEVVRFNACSPRGAFAVIWTASDSATGAPAEVQAVFSEVPMEMAEMVRKSVIPSGRDVAERFVDAGREAQAAYETVEAAAQ